MIFLQLQGPFFNPNFVFLYTLYYILERMPMNSFYLRVVWTKSGKDYLHLRIILKSLLLSSGED